MRCYPVPLALLFLALLWLHGPCAVAKSADTPSNPRSQSVATPVSTPPTASSWVKVLPSPLPADENAESAITPQATEQPPSEADDEAGSLPETTPPSRQSVSSPPADGTPEAPTGVMVDIQSKELRYDDERAVYVATGLVHVLISEQNSELIADKVTYDQVREVLIAEGNVRIIRNGEETDGSYARIDLTRQSALINDAYTQVESVRVKAQEAYVNKGLVSLKNGKLILSRDMLLASLNQNTRRQQGLSLQDSVVGANQFVLRTGWQPHNLNTRRAIEFADADSLAALGTGQGQFLEYYKQDGIQLDTSELPKASEDPWDLKVSKLLVRQYPDNYERIDLKWPKLYFKNVPLLTVPDLDFGVDRDSGRFDYLGPKIGFDRDLGGFHAGPGFDFRLGPGMVKVSPLATWGQGINRESDGSFASEDSAFGLGLNALYMDDNTLLQFARTTQNNYNVGYAERRIFDGRTRLLATLNKTYSGGLLTGLERPAYSLQVTDQRPLFRGKLLTLHSYASAGFFKDEFNPTNDTTFFVNRPATGPAEEGRLLSQLLLTNTRPLFSLGNVLDFGFMAQMVNSAYTSGDFQNVLRGGPTINFHYKDRFMSQAYLAATRVTGDTPFVFDSYFLGNQSLSWNNALRLNKYITVGARQDFDLSKTNAQDDSIVGNVVYITVGPPDVKLHVGFDVVRQVTYFGLNFYPSSGSNEMKFDEGEIYRPQPYFQLPNATLFPGNANPPGGVF